MVEIWKDIPNYEGFYQASSVGRIRSLTRKIKKWDGFRTTYGKIMKTRKNKAGYPMIKICKMGQNRFVGVHVLILETFIGPCPAGLQCRHLDGNPSNNNIENLCWGTAKENSEDKTKHGTQPIGEKQGGSKLRDSDIPEIHKKYQDGASCRKIAEEYEVSDQAIKFALSGHTFKHCQPKTPAKIRASGFQKSNRARGKLSEAVREQIVADFQSGHSYTEIAKKLNVNYTTVWCFINKKSYV